MVIQKFFLFQLHALNEIVDSMPDHTMLRNLYRQIEPIVVITDTRAQQTFSSCLRSLITETSEDSTSESGSNDSAKIRSKLNFLPTEEFSGYFLVIVGIKLVRL